MQAGLFKIVSERFGAALANDYPSFKPAVNRPGWREWRNELASNLYCIIALQAFEDWDTFTIEIAWNDVDAFPYKPLKKPRPEDVRGRRRLGSIWRDAVEPGWSGRSPDWDLAPEFAAAIDELNSAATQGRNLPFPQLPPLEVVRERVPGLVDDALEKLEAYAMPFLREVARANGVEWRA